ncbi:hypothetical protein [Microbacterium sp. 2FI]|uniref:hypothetical protein n=1 Tax=Microbacterium sp. 2FI TaxID=2502193 RepID=UPI0010F68910|nr:hypothetical protein [Microbacterium sp. 2FI]
MTIPLIVDANTIVDAAFWMKAATQSIRSECGWHVAPVITETLVLDGRGGVALLLPSQRVEAVTLVKNDGVDVTSRVKFSRRTGVMTLASGWSCDLGSIEITLTHGYPLESVADIAALIVTLTKRGAASSAFVQQSVGSASARLGTGRDGAALSVPLLESEKALLEPYRLNWGA